MKKKILELQNERTSLITTMDEVVKRSESVARTEEDQKIWDDSDERISAIDAELKMLERQEALNIQLAKRATKTPEEKVAKRFDMAKAVSEARNGRLTGLEKEMHDEATNELRGVSGVVGNLYIPSFMIKRANEETKTTGAAAGHIKTDVDKLSVIAADPLYKKLGATVYENLPAGILELPFSQGHAAAKVAEGSAASQSVPTDTKGTLTPTRFQGWQKFTQEYLSASSLMDQVVVDMVEATERGIGKALLEDAIATSVISGFATSDTAAAITYNGVLDMIAALNSDLFKTEGFAMSKELFWELAAKEKASGTAKFIIDFLTGNNSGMINGINAFGSSFLPLHDTNKYDILYGDMSQLFVGKWGGVQLLIDPYSASDNGYVKITFSQMAAVDTNPYAVSSKRNVTVS